MSAVFHGGRLDQAVARFGGSRDGWLDLSTGINPNPYPVPQLAVENWSRLPDDSAVAGLLAAGRDYYGVPAGWEIVAAPGTQALIELLPRVLEAGKVAIVSPTYAEHAHSWGKAGAVVSEVSELAELDHQVGVVVSPNNPTAGTYGIRELSAAAQRVDWLVVDEAFGDSEPGGSVLADPPANAIVLKSFGKFFGLAGMRLGFAICKPEPAAKIREMLGPWAVSGPALETGRLAFRDTGWIEQTRQALVAKSADLATCLETFGLEVAGVNPLFVFAKHARAQQIYEHLLRDHILVRPFPGHPDALRFGLCGDEAGMARLSISLKRYRDG